MKRLAPQLAKLAISLYYNAALIEAHKKYESFIYAQCQKILQLGLLNWLVASLCVGGSSLSRTRVAVEQPRGLH